MTQGTRRSATETVQLPAPASPVATKEERLATETAAPPALASPAVAGAGTVQGSRSLATETVWLPALASLVATKEGTHLGKATEQTTLGESRGGKAFVPHSMYQTVTEVGATTA